jgi:hypothetical protein
MWIAQFVSKVITSLTTVLKSSLRSVTGLSHSIAYVPTLSLMMCLKAVFKLFHVQSVFINVVTHNSNFISKVLIHK